MFSFILQREKGSLHVKEAINLTSFKEQILWSLRIQDHGNAISPMKKDNFCIAVKLGQKYVASKCPLFRGTLHIVAEINTIATS